MTPYHSQYWAHALTLRSAAGSIETLSRSLSNARIDLNPHQIDAALFALRSPLSRGDILADELIGKIEMQMKRRQTCCPIFAVRWRVQ